MKLGIQLKNKISYSNFGNFFSRALIIKENYTHVLVFVGKDEYIVLYKKIFDFLSTKISAITHESDLVDCLYNASGIFFMNTELLRSINRYTFEKERLIHLQKGHEICPQDILGKLLMFGYTYSEYASPGTYKKIGDILSISSFTGYKSYEVSLWGDTIESIIEIEKVIHNGELIPTKRTEKDEVFFGKKVPLGRDPSGDTSILDMIIHHNVLCVADSLEFDSHYTQILGLPHIICFDMVGNNIMPKTSLSIEELNINSIDDLRIALDAKETYIYTKNTKLFSNFTEYNNFSNVHIIESVVGFLKSFKAPSFNVICDDILLRIFIKRRVKQSMARDFDLLLKVQAGDFVVHIEHGIGIFQGIVKKELGGIQKEYVEIDYKGDDKLFVPSTDLERISKYVGVENPGLSGLGGKIWAKAIEKAERDIQHIAEELLEVYASRKLHNGFSSIRYTDKERIFQDSFPYVYTNDQRTAIDDIIKDMESAKNMDRLLVGDVGFGKTEIAFNAIYTAYLNKKQAVLISPLVVLAYEHYEKAIERFSSFGLKIGVLTRLESIKRTKETINRLASGDIDLVIGTHKVLSEHIVYNNLGLIVIDEEHKFGVEDKEKIKKIKTKVDSLAMSATPIPRSLNMALSGIRDISILKEAPLGRKDIITSVCKFDEGVIETACRQEFARNGQVFFVHNRVENIENMKGLLEKIFPDKKIVITHGRLPGDELEDRIMDFKHKKYDVLLSTTVIENGIDFSNVNTIFINECQSYGLSQIHQLRGRVGRSPEQGYCYLLYKNEFLGDDAVKRLKTIVKYSYLGAGFELAIKDLEIRGGGEILGIKQSGQATEIGVNLFIEMLEDKIEELKHEGSPLSVKKKSDISIELSISALIPDDLFLSETDKINFYREIETIDDRETLDSVIDGFSSLTKELPKESLNLFNILKLKLKAKEYKIRSIKRVGLNYEINFLPNISVEELKIFLRLDKEIKFNIVSLDKIRTAKKNFHSDLLFLDYLLHIFGEQASSEKPRKIKLSQF